MYDWEDIAVSVENELLSSSSDWIYRHIVIDEGQDFSPIMLRSLAAAVMQHGSLTFFGDVAQQVYGIRVSWKNAGLVARGNIWEFKENYRNTKEIAKLALAISQMPYFLDETDLIVPNSPRADGPLPSLVEFADTHLEMQFIVRQAMRLGQTRPVGLLVRKREQVRRLIAELNRGKVSVFELHPERGKWDWGPGVFVGTYQAAKGLEFETVLMPNCDTGNWPNPDRINEVGINETSAEDARLLYVGVTRARTNLIITFTGEKTELLPSKGSLYNRSYALPENSYYTGFFSVNMSSMRIT